MPNAAGYASICRLQFLACSNQRPYLHKRSAQVCSLVPSKSMGVVRSLCWDCLVVDWLLTEKCFLTSCHLVYFLWRLFIDWFYKFEATTSCRHDSSSLDVLDILWTLCTLLFVSNPGSGVAFVEIGRISSKHVRVTVASLKGAQTGRGNTAPVTQAVTPLNNHVSPAMDETAKTLLADEEMPADHVEAMDTREGKSVGEGLSQKKPWPEG